jgi:CRP-like cAMP-binding protein
VFFSSWKKGSEGSEWASHDACFQDNRELIASALEPVEFRAGQTVFRQGERGERFYIVQEGAVTVSKTAGGERTVLAKLGEGAYFGERALIKDDVR